jgi:hypothetical protein
MSFTKPSRLMLFRETVAVCCVNHTELTDTICGQNEVYINSVHTSKETLRFRYRAQPVNAKMHRE